MLRRSQQWKPFDWEFDDDHLLRNRSNQLLANIFLGQNHSRIHTILSDYTSGFRIASTLSDYFLFILFNFYWQKKNISIWKSRTFQWWPNSFGCFDSFMKWTQHSSDSSFGNVVFTPKHEETGIRRINYSSCISSELEHRVSYLGYMSCHFHIQLIAKNGILKR